jgi:hypothetical protein
MTALPTNLALVGEDLARATLRDVRRSAKRRRAVTVALVLALVVVAATTAIANSWLLSDTATVQAVPSLGPENDTVTHTLLSGLGPQERVLTAVTTAGGGVCITLTGYTTECVPTFKQGQMVDWVITPSRPGATIVWGIVRDEVTAIQAVSATGESAVARVANDGFYVELPGSPDHLVIQLSSGGSEVVPLVPCPPVDPNCTR